METERPLVDEPVSARRALSDGFALYKGSFLTCIALTAVFYLPLLMIQTGGAYLYVQKTIEASQLKSSLPVWIIIVQVAIRCLAPVFYGLCFAAVASRFTAKNTDSGTIGKNISAISTRIPVIAFVSLVAVLPVVILNIVSIKYTVDISALSKASPVAIVLYAVLGLAEIVFITGLCLAPIMPVAENTGVKEALARSLLLVKYGVLSAILLLLVFYLIIVVAERISTIASVLVLVPSMGKMLTQSTTDPQVSVQTGAEIVNMLPNWTIVILLINGAMQLLVLPFFFSTMSSFYLQLKEKERIATSVPSRLD